MRCAGHSTVPPCVSEFQPGAAEVVWESSEGNFGIGERQCVSCKTHYITLLKNDLFVPNIFKVCLYSLTQEGSGCRCWILLQCEQVELVCPSAVPLSSSGAKARILEELQQIHPFGKEAVKVVKFARKLDKLEAVLKPHDD